MRAKGVDRLQTWEGVCVQRVHTSALYGPTENATQDLPWDSESAARLTPKELKVGSPEMSHSSFKHPSQLNRMGGSANSDTNMQ